MNIQQLLRSWFGTSKLGMIVFGILFEFANAYLDLGLPEETVWAIRTSIWGWTGAQTVVDTAQSFKGTKQP